MFDEVTPNRQVSAIAPDSPIQKVVTRMRRRMYARFERRMRPVDSDLILDVGVTSESDQDSSNYLEAWYPRKDRIVAVGLDDAGFLESRHPGVRFARADGLALPFADRAFDLVHSSAVLEHVGSRERQQRYLRELFRVCRRGVFITTPNRWFPIEVHTLIPFAHWLPRNGFEAVCRSVGRTAFASENVLNLLGRADLERLAARLGARAWRVDTVRLLGWPSNLLLSVWT